MSEASSGVGGVGGSTGAGGAGGVGASTGTTTADDVADAMVDAARGPLGIDTAALGGLVAGLQAQNPAFGATVQAAVTAQLPAVDAGRLQGAIDAALAAQPGMIDRLTTTGLSAPADVTTINPTYSRTVEGHLVDACGTRLAEISERNPLDVMAEKAQQAYKEHYDKVVGGPVSGPAYSIAYAAGASEKTLNNVHAVGRVLDGFAEPLSQKAETMHVPSSR